jgi:hypothetical protein
VTQMAARTHRYARNPRASKSSGGDGSWNAHARQSRAALRAQIWRSAVDLSDGDHAVGRDQEAGAGTGGGPDVCEIAGLTDAEGGCVWTRSEGRVT